jgi:hypothetical protein
LTRCPVMFVLCRRRESELALERLGSVAFGRIGYGAF